MKDSVLHLITQRRSIREFTGDPVDRQLLVTALEAAMAAPSANNMRPWHFLVVTEIDKVKAICRAHPYAAFGENAGAVILPFGKKEGAKWFDQDMAAATENLLIALANLGLGATWCGMSESLQADIRRIGSLPNELFVFALIPVGVPAEIKESRTQYEDARVHWEDYSAEP